MVNTCCQGVWSKLPESRVERQNRTTSEGDSSLSSDVIDVDIVSEANDEEDAVAESSLAVASSENETSSVVAAAAADVMETKNNNNKGLFSGFFSDIKKHPAANLIKEQQTPLSTSTQVNDEINEGEEVRTKTVKELEEEARIARMEQLEMQEQIDEDADADADDAFEEKNDKKDL